MVPVTAPVPGDVLELAVGEAVHGGWCVARGDQTGGQVVFVRHALPGERVRAVITQATARLARADAVQILQPSADRVQPPCPHARPGGCGGCDWQHASLPAQRALKAAVISQQLARIGGIDREVSVQPLPGDDGGLRWRTRVTFAVGPDGTAGLRRHRSHEVLDVGECPIAHPLVTATGVTGATWPAVSSVQVFTSPETCQRAVTAAQAGRTGPKEQLPEVAAEHVQLLGRSGARIPVRGSGHITRQAAGRSWRVSLGGFWQVHPGAADVLASAVLDALAPQPGDRALDLYSGAGLFAGVLAEAVGPGGSVTAIEGDRAAVRDARHNLRDWPWARVRSGDVGELLGRDGTGGATLAVLDPPRAGVARQVIDALCAAAELTAIAYVSCDPATLARDLALLLAGGWVLDDLRGYDAFPMTHHVECLAALTRRRAADQDPG